jgi:hypothetical protein
MRRLRLILVEATGRTCLRFIGAGAGVRLFRARRRPVVWNGVPMRSGMLLFHARRDRFHQRSTGTLRWD